MSASQRAAYVSKHGLGGEKGWRDWASRGKGASKSKQRYQADQKAKRVNYVRKEMVESAKKYGGVTKKGKSAPNAFDRHMDQKAADSGKTGRLRQAKAEGREAAALKTQLKNRDSKPPKQGKKGKPKSFSKEMDKLKGGVYWPDTPKAKSHARQLETKKVLREMAAKRRGARKASALPPFVIGEDGIPF